MIRIRTLALGAMLAAGISSVAIAQADAGRTDSARVKRAHARGEMDGSRMMLFRGITLNDAQRARIREIHAQYKPRYEALRTQARAARPDSVRREHARRMRPDTAIMRQMRAIRVEQQAAIRGVLTAEQQLVFDRNVANRAEARVEGGDGHRGRRGEGMRRGGRRGQR